MKQRRLFLVKFQGHTIGLWLIAPSLAAAVRALPKTWASYAGKDAKAPAVKKIKDQGTIDYEVTR